MSEELPIAWLVNVLLGLPTTECGGVKPMLDVALALS